MSEPDLDVDSSPNKRQVGSSCWTEHSAVYYHYVCWGGRDDLVFAEEEDEDERCTARVKASESDVCTEEPIA